ncbi:hypothetical protein M569_17520 [Genlisea aurea]|uniref:Uncharacterized protein n=1 Tax=Genlisea aurea TaxID=192259 RepID=S8D3K8_9LAMI|nr:hypothetical protein M569_17520 [Genlisea aurea]
MAKENSKSTEEAITDIDHNVAMTQKEDRQNLAATSGFDHNLAILQIDKSTAPSGLGNSSAARVRTVEPSGECDKHTAENYANTENEALHLKKSTDETGSAFLSPVRSATIQNNQETTRKKQVDAENQFYLQPLQNPIEINLFSNKSSDAHFSNSGTQLRLSAVVNEGKGVSALTEVTSAKNKSAVSENIAPPGIKMFDKADQYFRSASHLLSSANVGNDGEGRHEHGCVLGG